MRIEEIKEKIRQHEVHLLGMTSSTSTNLVKRTLLKVSNDVCLIMSGLEHDLKDAKKREDTERTAALNALYNRAHKMYEGYVNLAASMGVKFDQPLTAPGN